MAPFPIAAAHAVLEDEGGPLPDRFVPGIDRRLGVVGMNRARPSEPFVLFAALPGQRSPARLLAAHLSGRIVRPDHALYGIDRRPELFFARAQILKMLPGFVLPAPRSKGRLGETYECGRMERPLQERHIAEDLERPAGGGIALQPASP